MPSEVLANSYDYRLVALSVVIAMVASYAGLDLGDVSPLHEDRFGPFGCWVALL